MRPTLALRAFRPTPRYMAPKNPENAPTMLAKFRQLKNMPAELLPLAVVVGFAVIAASVSITRKFMFDRNLRLIRENRQINAINKDKAGDH